MYIAAIIPAAGYGLRLKNRVPKALIKIGGIPIIIYTLKAISQHPYIKEVIVVANKFNIKAVKSNIKQYRIRKISDIVIGGATRRLSVENGLKTLGADVDFVLIHDAVRPFVQQKVISKVIDKAKNFGAAVVGVPVKATIKKVKNYLSAGGQDKLKVKSNLMVEETLNRDYLWEIQTPQVFKKDLILKAYRQFKDIDVTDDSMLVEKLGVNVGVVLGSYDNIKITTPEDLISAEAILKNQKSKFKNQNYIPKSKIF